MKNSAKNRSKPHGVSRTGWTRYALGLGKIARKKKRGKRHDR